MKTIAIIQARMSSTRLPGKILKPVLGQPMLARQIERVKHAQTLDQIIVATTTDSLDAPIYRLANQLDIPSYRGSTNNVLDRFYQAALRFNADIIVRLTGDCPVIDPAIIDMTVTAFHHSHSDYVSNVHRRSFPRGMDTEAMSFLSLEIAWKKARSPHNREHVTSYIYARPHQFKLKELVATPAWHRPELRLTVDEMVDLHLVRKIYQALYPQKPEFTLSDIIHFLDQHSHLLNLNSQVRQKTAPFQRFSSRFTRT